jgi:putative ABC transport system substrate-binding protein
MNRRAFLVVVGGAALPQAAMPQSKAARIAILSLVSAETYVGFFRQGMRDLGYREGQNVIIEVSSAEGKQQQLDQIVAAAVRAKPDVIVTYQTPAVLAAQKATRTLPIVMMGAGDPVGMGIVASYARPGGNITGIGGTTPAAGAKTIELLRDVLPKLRRLAVLANATDPFAKPFVAQLESAASKLGIELRVAMVRTPQEYDPLFAEWEKRVDAVIVQPSLDRHRAANLALKHRLPSVSPSAPFVQAGGLMSYSNSPKELARTAAAFTDRILKGAKPAEMPIEQPTVFELIVNLKTAKALGISFPPPIIARADGVIQ